MKFFDRKQFILRIFSFAAAALAIAELKYELFKPERQNLFVCWLALGAVILFILSLKKPEKPIRS